MKSIDNTLEYLTSNRAKKVFFEELRKNVFNSGKLTVTKEDLQRLLFLSKDLFEVTWEMNTSIGRYDLLIHIPKVNSEDVRRVQVREKIVEYLLVKQAEYIAAAPANTEIKLSSSWVKGFNYQNVEIPLLSLPVHPHAKNSDMREYSES